MLQLEVDNLRKRLEHLNHDNDALKERVQVNHMARAKELEDQLAVKRTCIATQKQRNWPFGRRPTGWTRPARPLIPPTSPNNKCGYTTASSRPIRS
jgi:hypothetical protein